MILKNIYFFFLLLIFIYIIKQKKNKENFINKKKEYYIYYINLNHRHDRKKKMEAEFLKMNNLNNYTFINERIDAIKDSMGAIGCGKSHIKALKKAKDKNLDYIIIMEDDIELKKNKIEKYFDEIERLKNWDVIILSGHGKKIPYKNNISKAIAIKTTGMYIIKKKYYNKLIDNFQESVDNMERLNNNKKDINEKEWAIDMNWKKLQKKDNWYIFDVSLGHQKPDYSDIRKRKVNYTKKFK